MGSHDKVEGLKSSLVITNFSLLAVHTGLFLLFFFLKVRIMYICNIISLAFYICGIFIIRERKLAPYISITLGEVLIHLILATVCIGWGAGFPMYTMPIVFIAFYLHYVFSDNRFLGRLPEIGSFLSAITFLSLRVYTLLKPIPLYQVSPTVITIIYIANCAIIFGFIIICMYAFTSLVMNRETGLHELADFDELTQLYNRHKMRDVLDKANAATKEGKSKFSTAILDIDDFKKINDTYGHDAGDYVLRTISEIMRHLSRDINYGTATVGRWGGEEFLVVQEYDPTLAGVRKACENFIDEILVSVRNYSFIYMGNHFKLTMTAGIAYHDENEPISVTINRADRLLYNGKESGKNKMVAQ